MRSHAKSVAQKLCWLTLLSITFWSCTAPKSVRQNARAERLIDRAARLNPGILNTRSDTVYNTVTLYDTLRLPSASYSDTIHAPQVSDTLRVTDTLGRAEALLIWHPVSPRLILNVPELVRPIQVTGRVPVVVNQTTVKRTNWWRWLRSGYRWTLALGIFGAIILAALLLGWAREKVLP